MEDLIRQLKEADEIFLVTHINPDGDAIGSVAACAEACIQLGKKVKVFFPAPLPPVFEFITHHIPAPESTLPLPPESGETPLCLILDAPDTGRTGFKGALLAYASRQKLAYIDHHLAGDLQHLASSGYHNSHASAAAELCYELFIKLEIKLTPSISTSLLTGMYTDTGGFQFTNTTTRTLEIAAELMRRGARLNLITQEISRHKTVEGLRLLGVALENIILTVNKRCAVAVIGHEAFKETGASQEDTTGIIGQFNILPDIAFSLLICESEEGIIRGSLRSSTSERGKHVHVVNLARLLGGGGHPRASGFLLNGHLVKQNDHWQVT